MDITWCQVLSPDGHANCRDRACDCPCHLPIERSRDSARRPHSFPRERWAHTSASSKLRIVEARARRERQYKPDAQAST